VKRTEAITRLEALRAQTYCLETMLRVSVEFLEWYLSVLESFDEFFGPESSARTDFERIGFEIPSEWQRRGATRLRQELEAQHGTELPESFTIPLNDYHRKQLADARELLTSLLIELRKP
jgi:hypothetical protein